MRILRTSRNAADCLFSTIPKGLRIGCFSFQMWLSPFGAKDGQLHCISTCLRAARYKYLPIPKRKIWVHQVAERVQAHVLVCFLFVAMWLVLEMWMSAKGLGSCARQLLLELDQLRSMDVVLPTNEAGEVRLRVVAKPNKPLAQLLIRLGIDLPNVPKMIENVVPKMA